MDFDSRTFARKVINATQFSAYQTKENGAYWECPNCHYRIDNSDVSLEWPGLPAGVKFDPSDVELLEHLAGKVGLQNSKPHFFIDGFIPTLEEDVGICYKHPKDLHGAKKDGSSVYFFHTTANAYATGHRKRRKIENQNCLIEEDVRWHKTGKTKPIRENGVCKGWKKIMVLYECSKKGTKPKKLNWKMHQYHLGMEEDEEEGKYVVSKIFYEQQRKQNDESDVNLANEQPDKVTVDASPKTPRTNTPNLHQPGKRPLSDEDNEDNEFGCIQEIPRFPLPAIRLDDDKEGECIASKIFDEQQQKQNDNSDVDLASEQPDRVTVDASPKTPRTNTSNLHQPGKRPLSDEDNEDNESGFIQEIPRSPLPAICLDDDKVDTSWLAGESQAVENPDPNGMNDSLLCNEILDSNAPIDNPGVRNDPCFLDFNGGRMDAAEGDASTDNGIPDLDGIDLGTPPDFELADLQFGSEESIMSWLDRLWG